MIISRLRRGRSYTPPPPPAYSPTTPSLPPPAAPPPSFNLANANVQLPDWLANVLKAKLDTLKNTIKGKLADSLSQVASEWLSDDFASQVASSTYLLSSGIEIAKYPQLASALTFGRTVLYYLKKKHVDGDTSFDSYTNFLDYLDKRQLLTFFLDGSKVSDYSVSGKLAIGFSLAGFDIWLQLGSSHAKNFSVKSKYPFVFRVTNFSTNKVASGNININYTGHHIQPFEDMVEPFGFVEVDNETGYAELSITVSGYWNDTLRLIIYPLLIDEELVPSQAQGQAQSQEGGGESP